MNRVDQERLVILGCGLTLLVLSTVFATLRLAVRFSRNGGTPDVGDLFLGLGWVSAISLTVLAIHGSFDRDYAEHISQIASVNDQVNAAFYVFVDGILYQFGLSSVKLSIFLFYHTLAVQLGNRKLVWTVRTFIVVITMFMIAYLVLPFVGCRPLEAIWLQVNPGYERPYTCINQRVILVVAGAINCLTDFSAGVVPLVLVQLLKKPVKAKGGLCFLLVLGFLVLAAGVVRTILLMELQMGTTDDWTWASAMVQIAALWELHLAITCACAPFIYKMHQMVWPRVKNGLLSVRFMRGRNINATKKLDSRPSTRSLRTKGADGAMPPIPATANVPRLDLADGAINNTISEKAIGKRKAKPTMDLGKSMPTAQQSTEDVLEIGIAYHPSGRRRKLSDLEVQSPTLPPDYKDRLSGYSWLTRASETSRWSSLKTAGTESIYPARSEYGVPKHSASPSKSSNDPPSPGFSSIDVGEHSDIPPLPELKTVGASLSPAHVACRSCGQYHSYGYRHSDTNVESSLPFGWLRRSQNLRQSHSTFFNDADEEDGIVSNA